MLQFSNLEYLIIISNPLSETSYSIDHDNIVQRHCNNVNTFFGDFFNFFSKSLESLENTHFLWHNIIKKIMKERLPERQAEKKSVGAFFYFFTKWKIYRNT